MSDWKLEAELRTVSGKQVRQLRRDGWVPAVLYGVNAPANIQLNLRSLTNVLRAAGPDVTLALQLGDRVHQVRLGEVQRHLTRGHVTHVDFLEVNA